MKIVSVLCVLVFLLAPSFALAHPHFSKTVSAKLPSGAEATITYGTTPANLGRAESATAGTFVSPRGPKLKLSAAAGDIPAGEYTIGVIKNSADDWTMALYTGGLARGETPGRSKDHQARLDVFVGQRDRRPHAHRHHAGPRQVRRQGRFDTALRQYVLGRSDFVRGSIREVTSPRASGVEVTSQ